jgi:APA family basic amino acid/polyamine antiporter
MEARGSTWREYLYALRHTPALLRRLALRTRTLEEELAEAMLRGSLRRAFSRFDLLMMGLGIVIGTGFFSLTGPAAILLAGSAVTLSYALVGLGMLAAAACFAELVVEFPVAGSSFSFVIGTFGELPAFLTLGMLALEYVFGTAEVARGFSRYLALLCGLEQYFFTTEWTGGGGQERSVDWMALAAVAAFSLALAFGAAESWAAVNGVTLAKLALLVAIAIAGFVKASAATFAAGWLAPVQAEMQIAAPGAEGIFLAAGLLVFASTGFDAICNTAEEARSPAALPGALLGTVLVSSTLYVALAAAQSLMATPEALAAACGGANGCVALVDAFAAVGLPAMRYVVALAALAGTATALLVSLWAGSRLAMVAARGWLLPRGLARVSPRWRTPLRAHAALGALVFLAVLLVPFLELPELSSLGSLFSAWAVANVVLYRRFHPGVKLRFTGHGTVEAASPAAGGAPAAPPRCGCRGGLRYAVPPRARRALFWVHAALINGLAVAGSVQVRVTNDLGHTAASDRAIDAAMFALWLAAVLAMALAAPLEYEPAGWRVPRALLPAVPALAIGISVFAAANLPGTTVYAWAGVYVAALLAIYLLYALPMSYLKHFVLEGEGASNLPRVVELELREGAWVAKGGGGGGGAPPDAALSAALSAAVAGSWPGAGSGGTPSGGAPSGAPSAEPGALGSRRRSGSPARAGAAPRPQAPEPAGAAAAAARAPAAPTRPRAAPAPLPALVEEAWEIAP